MTALINMPRAAWRRQPQRPMTVNANNPYSTNLEIFASFGNVSYEAAKCRGVNTAGCISRGNSIETTASKLINVGNTPPLRNGFLSYIIQTRRVHTNGQIFLVGFNPLTLSASTAAVTKSSFQVSLSFSQTDNHVRYYYYGYTHYSGGQKLYLFDENGVLLASVTRATTETEFDAANRSVLIGGQSGTYRQTDARMAALWMFDANNSRSLDEGFFRQYLQNPYQVVSPAPSRFYLIPSSGGVLTLIVQNASHSHSVDAPSLTQAHVLALADSLHGHSVESPILSQAYALSLAAAAHAHNADNLVLSQAQSIAVADTTHSHSADNIALTQAHILATADTAHSHSAEAPTLFTGLNLSLSDATHSQSADSPVLIQAHILSLSDATHSHSAESVSMGQGYMLTVADTAHSHTAEAPTVTVAFVLAIQDALHSQAADALALATQVTLVVSDALHAHLAGSSSEITLPTGDRIFLVANEDRLFLVASSDRLFGV